MEKHNWGGHVCGLEGERRWGGVKTQCLASLTLEERRHVFHLRADNKFNHNKRASKQCRQILSFTLLRFPFHPAPDSFSNSLSLSVCPLQTQAPQPGAAPVCRGAGCSVRRGCCHESSPRPAVRSPFPPRTRASP